MSTPNTIDRAQRYARVTQLLEQELTMKQIAERTGVTMRQVYRLRKKREKALTTETVTNTE